MTRYVINNGYYVTPKIQCKVQNFFYYNYVLMNYCLDIFILCCFFINIKSLLTIVYQYQRATLQLLSILYLVTVCMAWARYPTLELVMPATEIRPSLVR